MLVNTDYFMVVKVLLLGMVITGRGVADKGITVAFFTPVTDQKHTKKLSSTPFSYDVKWPSKGSSGLITLHIIIILSKVDDRAFRP